jgi:transcriptional regulator
MIAKNRDSDKNGRPHGKLNDEKVREIRRLSDRGMSQRDLAWQFGVTQANISVIIRRKTWKHVT